MTLYKKQIREVKKTVEVWIPAKLIEITDWIDEDDYKPTLIAGEFEKIYIEERFVKVEA